jgi:hypothetical protein
MPAVVADLVALEQVGGHRDHGHREGLVREAAQGDEGNGRIGTLHEADAATPSMSTAPRVKAQRRASMRSTPRF